MFLTITSLCAYKTVDSNGKSELNSSPLLGAFLDLVAGIALLVIGGLVASGSCFPNLNAATTIYAFLIVGSIEISALLLALLAAGAARLSWSYPTDKLITLFK